MEAQADLHTHTNHSDGALSPYELLSKAKSVGLSILSITDHDTVSAVEEATEFGREFDVEVVPGVELSASLGDTEVHILGYFIDCGNPQLLAWLLTFRRERLKRAQRIVDKLNGMNVPLTMESVLANAAGASVCRPHIATALVNDGHVRSYHHAFDKFIGDGRPAYEKKTECSPEDTIRVIAEAGGLSFLAHPGGTLDEVLLMSLIEAGLDGIEVVHPSHSPEVIQHYRGIVNEYCLLESGGSDFHGGVKGGDYRFGRIGVPVRLVDNMRSRRPAV